MFATSQENIPYTHAETGLLLAKSKGFAILKLSISCDVPPDFTDTINATVEKHNSNILSDAHPDSGVDLHIPNNVTFTEPNESVFIDMGVKGAMYLNNKPCAYQIFPRSSISKTPLILANHTGIIDSGYRGNLIAAIKYLPYEHKNGSKYNHTITKHTRLVQVCHPTLIPIFVLICPEEELSATTRGECGFGSTGV